MDTPSTEDFNVLESNDQWSLIKPAQSPHYALIWLADTPPDPTLLETCNRVGEKLGRQNGLSLSFATTPAVGFVLRFKPGWAPEGPAQVRRMFMQMLWEIEREHQG